MSLIWLYLETAFLKTVISLSDFSFLLLCEGLGGTKTENAFSECETDCPKTLAIAQVR